MKKAIMVAVFALMSATTVFSQRDYAFNPNLGWSIDSLTLLVMHWRTQSVAEDSMIRDTTFRQVLGKYIFEEKGWLVANFPKDYKVYPLANFHTGNNDLTSKKMVTVETQAPDKEVPGNILVMRAFNWTHELLGKGKVKICRTDKKAYVYLSL